MNIAIILLSGKGTRLGGETPKQFIMVNNRPVYSYSLRTFYNNKKIDKIILVTNKEYVQRVKEDIKRFKYTKKPIEVIEGGSERYLSVKNAVNAMSSKKYRLEDKILIHDGVRPNVTDRIINENISGLELEPCVLTAIKTDNNQPAVRVDTIHFLHNQYYRAQTPQSFRLNILRYIYEKAENYKPFPFTDDISLAIVCNYSYVIVDGDEKNYKITRPEDLERFKEENKK